MTINRWASYRQSRTSTRSLAERALPKSLGSEYPPEFVMYQGRKIPFKENLPLPENTYVQLPDGRRIPFKENLQGRRYRL